MSDEEMGLRRDLFRHGLNRLELKQKNHTELKEAQDGVKETLQRVYKKSNFANNTSWFLAGVVITALFLVSAALLSKKFEVLLLCVWLTGWTFGVVFLLKNVAAQWKGVAAKKGLAKAGGMGGALFITLFSLPFIAGECFAIVMLGITGTIWLVIIAILMGLINLKFWFWLKQPTPEGKRLMDEIDGFKMYMGTAEGAHLAQAESPMKTLELFEAYLPYAIALGVEKQWADQFDPLFAMADQAGTMSSSWYVGSTLAAGGMSGFASSFSSGFSGAMTSASSSGSGGGGSSGGGGGGGGGGGW